MTDAPPRPFRQGDLETRKFAHRRDDYWRGLQDMVAMGFSPADLIHHAPAFAGEINLARFLALYEAYKATLGLAGHIAEFGIYMGTNVLFFAKLARLFEPASLTLVHGFDWFRGVQPEGEEARLVDSGAYTASFETVSRLVTTQHLDDIVRLHDMDLASDALAEFIDGHGHLQFRLVVLDCGLYTVVRNCIERIWPRLVPGGWLVLDNFNHETSPGEARAVRELLPGLKVRTFPFCAQPTAYIVKPEFGQ